MVKYGLLNKTNKLTETIPEEAQKLDLLDKDLKLIVIKMLKELKESMKNLQKSERNRNKMKISIKRQTL